MLQQAVAAVARADGCPHTYVMVGIAAAIVKVAKVKANGCLHTSAIGMIAVVLIATAAAKAV